MSQTHTVMDANGDIRAEQGRWVYLGRCREETNGKGQEIVRDDFKSYKFSSLIHCPVSTGTVDEGRTIMVTDAEITRDYSVRIKGECAKCDPGRLHNRIWV